MYWDTVSLLYFSMKECTWDSDEGCIWRVLVTLKIAIFNFLLLDELPWVAKHTILRVLIGYFTFSLWGTTSIEAFVWSLSELSNNTCFCCCCFHRNFSISTHRVRNEKEREVVNHHEEPLLFNVWCSLPVLFFNYYFIYFLRFHLFSHYYTSSFLFFFLFFFVCFLFFYLF